MFYRLLSIFLLASSAATLSTAHAQTALDAVKTESATEEFLPWLQGGSQDSVADEALDAAADAAEAVEEVIADIAEEVEEIAERIERISVNMLGYYAPNDAIDWNEKALKEAIKNKDIRFIIRSYSVDEEEQVALTESLKEAKRVRKKLLRKGVDENRVDVYVLGNAIPLDATEAGSHVALTLSRPVEIDA